MGMPHPIEVEAEVAILNRMLAEVHNCSQPILYTAQLLKVIMPKVQMVSVEVGLGVAEEVVAAEEPFTTRAVMDNLVLNPKSIQWPTARYHKGIIMQYLRQQI